MTKLCRVDGAETVTKTLFPIVIYEKTIWLRFLLQEVKRAQKTVGDGFYLFLHTFCFK